MSNEPAEDADARRVQEAKDADLIGLTQQAFESTTSSVAPTCNTLDLYPALFKLFILPYNNAFDSHKIARQ